MATILSTFTEVLLADTRTRSGTVLLPPLSQIPYRMLTFKDVYGTFSNSTLTLSTQAGNLFEDNTNTIILSNAYSFFNLYAASTKWLLLDGTQTLVQSISTLNVNSLNIGNGLGWLQLGPIQTVALSTTTIFTNSMYANGISSFNLSTAQLSVSSIIGVPLVYTSSLVSTTLGLQTYISTFIDTRELASTVTNFISSTFFASQLTSTVAGLGTVGYLSTSQLVSTVTGLGTIGYVSTPSLVSTVRGLGTAGYISSASLLGLVSTPNLLNLVSTNYFTSQLVSTVAGLGQAGYISSLSTITLSTGTLIARTVTLTDINTNNQNLLTTSSGVLLLNGSGIGSGGGGGSGLTVSDYVVGGRLNADQNLTADVDNTIEFIDDYDPQGWYNTSTYFFTPTIAGYYLVSYQVWFNTGAVSNNQYNIQIQKNSADSYAITQLVQNTVTGTSLNASKIIYLNGSTDNLRFRAFVGNTSNTTAKAQQGNANGTGTFFTAALLTNGSSGAPLFSTVTGLGTAGYVSTSRLAGLVSTPNLLNLVSTSYLSSQLSGLAPSNWSQYPAISSIELYAPNPRIINPSPDIPSVFQTGFLILQDKFNTPGNMTAGTVSFATSTFSEIYTIVNDSFLTGTISSLGLAYFDGITLNSGSFYLSSLYLGNFGGTVAGQLTTDDTATNLYWNGTSLTSGGGGGIATADLVSTVEGLGTAGYLSTIGNFLSTQFLSAGDVTVSTLSLIDGLGVFPDPSYLFNNAGLIVVKAKSGLAVVNDFDETNTIISQNYNIIKATITGQPDFNYSLTAGTYTGTISTPTFVENLNGFVTGLYISSIFLGNNGASIYGEISTDDTATNLYWKGVQLNGGGGGGSSLPPYLSSFSLSTGEITTSSIIAESGFFSSISTYSLTVFGPSTLTLQGKLVMDGGNIAAPLVSTLSASTSNGFVAVGYGISFGVGSILYSYDGSNWSNATGSFGNLGSGVAYNGSNLYVATGQPVIFPPYDSLKYSTDGKSWFDNTTSGFGTGGIGVAFYNGLWVVVGNDSFSSPSNIQYSSDGSNWFASASGAFIVSGNGVANDGAGLWVAAGNDSGSPNTLKWSTDGSNWSDPVANALTNIGLGVAYGGGLWVAVGSDNLGSNIKYSSDGSNWSDATGVFANYGSGVAYNGSNLWVAAGYGSPGFSSNLKYSSDGSNWSDCVSGDFATIASGVAYNSITGLWVAAGYDTASNSDTLKWSTDGSNWNNPSSGAFTTANGGLGVTAATFQIPAVDVYKRYGIQNANTITASTIILADDFDVSPGTTFTSNSRLSIYSGEAFKASGSSWVTLSDRILKNNVQDANLDICYKNIKELPLRRFGYEQMFIDKANIYDKHVLGFIAQEVSTIFPKAVQPVRGYGFSTLLGLNQEQIQLSLFGTVKKLMKDKEDLESRFSTLEAKFTVMNS